MQNNFTRRNLLISGLGISVATALSGPNNLFASEEKTISPEEKKLLKEQLQRELERKVYSVSNELFKKVNRVKTPGKYVGHEKGHIPVILAPRHVKHLEPFTVKVLVGPKTIHDMVPFHYIDWISLSVDKVQINNIILTPLFNRPIITVELTLEETSILTAQEHCNLHGVWESEPFMVNIGEGR